MTLSAQTKRRTYLLFAVPLLSLVWACGDDGVSPTASTPPQFGQVALSAAPPPASLDIVVGAPFGGGIVAYVFAPGDPGYVADKVVFLPDGAYRESGPGIDGDGLETGWCGFGGLWSNPSGRQVGRAQPHPHCRRTMVASAPHGIIAAPFDQTLESRSGYYPHDRGVMWQPGRYMPEERTSVFDPTGSIETGMGGGRPNTLLILQTMVETGGDFPAARMAAEYRGGGFDDWVLPSRDELSILYANRALIGGFQEDESAVEYAGRTYYMSAWYWSSSEFVPTPEYSSFGYPYYAWAVNFSNGGAGPGYKGPGGTAYKVRAIRYF